MIEQATSIYRNARTPPARPVMQILGHSQITLTLGTYSHVEPEARHEAAQRIGRALWD